MAEPLAEATGPHDSEMTRMSRPEEAGSRRPKIGGRCAPLVFSKISPAQPTVVYDTLWRFAAERQSIFFRRLMAREGPWTDDPILAQYKFTNAYRASDRVSQYLIRNVIYAGDQSPTDVFFRIMIFKLFNRIETWELLREAVGEICSATYSYNTYESVLGEALAKRRRIYSAAYIMPSGKREFHSSRKHQNHLRLLEFMMANDLPGRLADARSMKDAFELFLSCPTVGPFLAYQFVTDLNYATSIDFSEMSFVAPGPGARDGIRKCFRDTGGLNDAEIIKVVADRQEEEFERLGIAFQSLWGRRLQLIDCQNLFCEVDKYARIAHPEIKGRSGRTRIKQRFRPSSAPLTYWYPPKWGLNDEVEGGARAQHSSQQVAAERE